MRLSADAQHQKDVYVLAEERSAGASNFSKVDSFTVVNLRAGYAVPARGKVGDVFVAVENSVMLMDGTSAIPIDPWVKVSGQDVEGLDTGEPLLGIMGIFRVSNLHLLRSVMPLLLEPC